MFASDLDGEAIAFGRRGVYPKAIAADVSGERLERFFHRENEHYRVRQEVRDHVLFAVHSLLKHPPFSRVDLVTCRNLLIYLERGLQEEVLRLFHYALRPDGYLFLGSAESADSATGLFEPVSKKHRIYRRRSRPSVPPRIPTAPAPGLLSVGHPTTEVHHRPPRSSSERHATLLERRAPPSAVVDMEGRLVHLSESLGRYLRRPGGTPTDDILQEVRPELHLDLQEALAGAFEHGRSTTRGPIQVAFDGDTAWVHLIVRPGPDDDPDLASFALVVFAEAEVATGGVESGEEPEADGTRVRELREEVQRLRERLQATVEEYESSKEEMKASNEELQSINEEYRSTSEELETSKEELQSINEELQTVNNELKVKLETISRAHSDLQNLMAASDYGTLFLDPNLRIKRFTERVSDL
ncbi:MAG TPA: CheR family methyltransferase, partial [Longimicrobiales bacterium]|nr:CheR family methyltransferase [Longimicrobiales bacterium]